MSILYVVLSKVMPSCLFDLSSCLLILSSCLLNLSSCVLVIRLYNKLQDDDTTNQHDDIINTQEEKTSSCYSIFDQENVS